MDSILAAAQAGVVAKMSDVAPKATVKPGRYSIGNSDLCVEWGWIRPGWGLSSRDDYVRWDDDGPLYDPKAWQNRQERGRQLILEHFGLESITDALPLSYIATLSPAEMFKMRRELEQTLRLPRKDDMISDRAGDRCSAEHCG